MKYLKFKTIIILLIISINSIAQTGGTVEFIGTDSNWFDPNNWSNGSLPDANTDIVLTAGQHIVIDPLHSPDGMPVVINNIDLNNATLSLLPDSQFQYNKMLLTEDSLFDAKSSEVFGDALEINKNGTNPGGFGVRLNPTTNDNRSIKITASTTKIQLFLGGNMAASSGNTGIGFYANLSADDIVLDGTLEVDTIYGFEPQVGDIFEFINARNSLMGQFNNLHEGSLLTLNNDYDLRISYRGGDGNDVTLTVIDKAIRFIGTDSNLVRANKLE